jgi:hypothetical protein
MHEPFYAVLYINEELGLHVGGKKLCQSKFSDPLKKLRKRWYDLRWRLTNESTFRGWSNNGEIKSRGSSEAQPVLRY